MVIAQHLKVEGNSNKCNNNYRNRTAMALSHEL